jgi:tyrosyl-tRNA synthetase
MKVDNQLLIKTALNEIQRGNVEIIDNEKIEELVLRFFTTGETFTVKAGFDPTAPDLHLGHTVLLHKLATFQKYGGIIQFLIGDFTAQIGDPTGKSQTRKQLTPEEILINAKTFEEQVFKILDKDKTQVVFNSKWLNELGSVGMLELTTHFNVARMLERDDFEKRHKNGISISISEFIYPLLQGFDSVHLKSDIEIGGTDQKFNLLMGRHLQGSFKLDKKQAILMMPILEGLDGVNKMSKSLNNFIAIKDTPNVMFDKIINISDTLMWRFFELLSDKTLIEIETLKSNVDNNFLNPKHIKEMLAIEIISRFHSSEEALNAVKEAKEILKGNTIPSDIKTLEIVLNDNETLWIAKAMVDTGLTPSATQGRKDISNSLLKVNGEIQSDTNLQLEKGEFILQLGKKKFAKIILK